MKKIIKLISEKWIKGHCHHLCILCEHWDVCKYDFGFDNKYEKGLQHGYDMGYMDGLRDGANSREK